MRTNEFISKIKALGYEVDNFLAYLSVSDSDGHDFATVSKKHRFSMDTDTFHFATHVNDEDAEKIATLLFEYSATPLEDREEERRYRLRVNIPLLLTTSEYLFMNVGTGKRYLGQTPFFGCTNIFTESELAEMDITGFEKIRVME